MLFLPYQSSFTLTSCSVPPSVAITLPRYVNEFTSSITSFSRIIASWLVLLIRITLVLLFFMLRPVVLEVVASDWTFENPFNDKKE